MGEIFALQVIIIGMVLAFAINSWYVITGVVLIVAAIIIIVAVILLRSSNKKKQGSAAAESAGWQRQAQAQQGVPGVMNAWRQQQADAWSAQSSAQQQSGGWGAENLAPQQQSGWGAQSSAQPQSAQGWGVTSDAPSPPIPTQQQSNPAAYESGEGQSGVQPTQAADPWAQPVPSQAGRAQSNQQQVPIGPPSQPGLGSDRAFSSEDDDRTILRNAGSQSKSLEQEHLRFTAFLPRLIPAGTWSSLLVYAYIESALEAIQADAVKFRDELGPVPNEVDAKAAQPLARGTQITIIPTFQEVTFNPERITFTWIEDWHQVKFRFQVDRRLAGATRNGEITIYAGPLIIASLKISLQFMQQKLPLSIRDSGNMTEVSAYLYKQIFTSYSHSDTAIALLCRNVYKALGFDILIDIDNLRSGQSWNAALMRMIDTCDIFQLFWSSHAAQSQNVRQEWQYALQHNKGEGFIRPVYWEKPLVSPPKELSHLHFGYIELPKVESYSDNRRYIGGLGMVRVEVGKEPGRVYEVRKSSLSIGRSRERDIFLEDLAVSRFHASIINMGNGSYVLRDEGSANGTKVNDQTVNKFQPIPLKEGDRIQLGQAVLVFSIR